VWELVDDAGGDADDYAGVFRAIAHRLLDAEVEDWENGEFIPYVGEYMLDWLDCLAAIEERTETATARGLGDD
jgi:hypothetical protein